MKKVVISLLLMGWGSTALADGDRLIDRSQLPAKAQEFLSAHFGKTGVSFAKEDRELFELRYEVVLVGGEKVEFTRSGDWEEVSCRYASVPTAVVPDELRTYLGTHHPNEAVTEISRDRRGYELKLNNGLELKFNRAFTLIDIDD